MAQPRSSSLCNNTVTLQTDRLIMRPRTADDGDDVYRVCNDIQVVNLLHLVLWPYAKEEAHFYWYGRAHWGKGYATEVARGVIQPWIP